MLNKIARLLKGLFARRGEPKRRALTDDEFNEMRKMREDEANRILDKVSEKGAGSLTEKEKKFLQGWTKRQ